MTTVYHGSTTWKAHSLACVSRPHSFGLYVTDTAERAQLYADAQATEVVETEPRYANASVVAVLATNEEIRWHRRPESHPTLDKCEAIITTWRVLSVTAYMSEYNIRRSVRRDGKPLAEVLAEAFGDKLTIVEVADSH